MVAAVFAAAMAAAPLTQAAPQAQQIQEVPAERAQKAGAADEERRARVRFKLDDGTQESVISLNNEEQTRGLQAVLLNRFTPDEDELPLTIEVVSILFPRTCATGGTGLRRGMEFEVVIYLDPDGTGDPANATLALRQPFGIRPSDFRFQRIRLDEPVTVERGDVWIGYTNSATATDDRPIFHGALDRSSNKGRSWLFYNRSSSFTGDVLAAAQVRVLTGEAGIPGNWMIRARGESGGE
jgi:hypothetical protein